MYQEAALRLDPYRRRHLDATVVAKLSRDSECGDNGAGGLLEVKSVGYRRSAQILVRGYVPLYLA